jgi:hypothetical protein
MEQLEPKENQSPVTEQETRTDVPEPEGMLLGEYDSSDEAPEYPPNYTGGYPPDDSSDEPPEYPPDYTGGYPPDDSSDEPPPPVEPLLDEPCPCPCPCPCDDE